MHPSSVFASASSRLHADLIVIRLRRAGINPERISAVFPQHLRPNSAECWMAGATKPVEYRDEPMVVAGPLHKKLDLGSEQALIRSLQEVGLGIHDAAACADRIGKAQILIAIATEDETEVAIAWHTLRELEAEGIALAITSDERIRTSPPARRPRRWGSRKARTAASLLPTGVLSAAG